MKTTLILLLLSGIVIAQTYIKPPQWYTPPSDTTLIKYQHPLTIENFTDFWKDYQKECADTIRATKYEGEYLIKLKGDEITWLVTVEEINGIGYYYKYCWLKNNKPPFELEYVFVKKPTIEGFMGWLERKLK